ncbi:MAG: hypothetical protein GY758_34075 [Fuerstiella sp.]|nr:hypothetical protein [Fuerstiella sp.]
MFLLIREVAGWLLVLAALYLVSVGIDYVSNPEDARIVEAGIVMLAAMGILRAGILLVRISTAARICDREQP